MTICSTGCLRTLSKLILVLGIPACLYLAWRPSPFLTEVAWLPHEFARWADSQFNLRTAIPFALLGCAAVFATGGSGRVLGKWLILLACLGVLMELGQLFLPRRSFHFEDILFAWLGLIAGAVTGLTCLMLIRYSKKLFVTR